MVWCSQSNLLTESIPFYRILALDRVGGWKEKSFARSDPSPLGAMRQGYGGVGRKENSPSNRMEAKVSGISIVRWFAALQP